MVTARDIDSGLNGHLTYHIIYDADRLPFSIEPTTGFISNFSDIPTNFLIKFIKITLKVTEVMQRIGAETNRYVYSANSVSPVAWHCWIIGLHLPGLRVTVSCLLE